MTTFYDLPSELISRIFTCGSDDDDNEREHTLASYDSDISATFHKMRRPKMFTLTILPVCRQWRELALAKSNSHLFEAHIGLGEITVDIIKVITITRNLLRISNGCDLFITFVPTYFVMCVKGWTDTQYETHVCLTLHLLEMLGHYHRQWRWIYLDNALPQIVSFFSSVVNSSKRFPRLATFQTAAAIDPYGIFSTIRAAPSGPETPNSKRAFDHTVKAICLPSSKFTALTDLLILSLDNALNMIIPSSIRSLVLSSFKETALQWQYVFWLLRQAPDLRELAIYKYIGAPFRFIIGDQHFRSVFLDRLHILTIPYSMDTPEFIHHSINRDCLQSLSLTFVHHSAEEMESLLYNMIDLPNLRKLHLESLYHWHPSVLKFLAYTRMPCLKELSMTIKFRDHSIHQPSSLAMHSNPNPEDILKPSPTSLTITCESSILGVILSRINCSVVRSIIYKMWRLPDDDGIDPTLPRESKPDFERISFPSLTEANFMEATFIEMPREGVFDHRSESASTLHALREFLSYSSTPELIIVQLDDHTIGWDGIDGAVDMHQLTDICQSSGSKPPPLKFLRLKIYPPPPSASKDSYQLNRRLLFRIPYTVYMLNPSDYGVIELLHCPSDPDPELQNLSSSQDYEGFLGFCVLLLRYSSSVDSPSHKHLVRCSVALLLDTVVASWRTYGGLDLQWKQTGLEDASIWLSFEITRVESATSDSQ